MHRTIQARLSFRQGHCVAALIAAGVLAGISSPLSAQSTQATAAAAALPELRIGDAGQFCASQITGGSGGVLAGLVRDSASAFGLPGLEVRAEWGERLEPGQLRVGGPAQAGYVSDLTRPDGLYVLCGIAPGPYRVIITFADSTFLERSMEPLGDDPGRLDLELGFQTTEEPAGLFGYIRDANGAGLPGVRVTMTGVRSALTNQEGFFALDSLRPGLHLLDISDPDSPAQELPVLVPPGEAGEIAVTLGPEMELNGDQESTEAEEGVDLVLHPPSRLRGLRALEERRLEGSGYFTTRTELLQEIHYLGELLLVAPEMDGRRVINGRLPDFFMRRGGGSCTPALFVDGRRYRHPGGLTDFLGKELIAVELHRRRIPTEFKTMDGASACGIISAWTIAGTGQPEGS